MTGAGELVEDDATEDDAAEEVRVEVAEVVVEVLGWVVLSRIWQYGEALLTPA